jgi:hypothetical protein
VDEEAEARACLGDQGCGENRHSDVEPAPEEQEESGDNGQSKGSRKRPVQGAQRFHSVCEQVVGKKGVLHVPFQGNLTGERTGVLLHQEGQKGDQCGQKSFPSQETRV